MQNQWIELFSGDRQEFNLIVDRINAVMSNNKTNKYSSNPSECGVICDIEGKVLFSINFENNEARFLMLLKKEKAPEDERLR